MYNGSSPFGSSVSPNRTTTDDDAIQIRRLLPGVTAAATTAVFATGDGPGVTAAATTAVLATGARTTPTLPTRVGLIGISGSSRG
jgi:hypothetical protein